MNDDLISQHAVSFRVVEPLIERLHWEIEYLTLRFAFINPLEADLIDLFAIRIRASYRGPRLDQEQKGSDCAQLG